MFDKTIAMADNKTKRMNERDHNRLCLQATSIKTQKDEYQIDLDKRIGIGGESQVFLAKRLSDNMQVVIKIYDKYEDRRDRRDRKAVLEFLKKNTDYKHTHIMPLWDDGIIKMFDPENDDYFDSPFDIIPYCPEGEIKSANYSQLKNKIIPEVLHALNLLHSNNLVHRDIKPSNIYMYDGVVLLADFGTTSQILNKESHSKTQARRGTLGYTAPEISDSYYVVASDYYSLGCSIATLYNEGKHIYQTLIDADDIYSVNIAMRREGLPLECPASESDLQLLVDSLILKNEQQRATYEATNLWLNNTNSFVHKWKSDETQESAKTTISYKFEKIDYTNFKDLTVAIANNWEKGKQYLYRGIFKDSVFKGEDPHIENILFDIVEDHETAENQDLGLARFLHFLGTYDSPTCPIYWCGKTYEKLSDLASGMVNSPSQAKDTSTFASLFFEKCINGVERSQIDKVVNSEFEEIASLLESKFLSWKLSNTKPIDENTLNSMKDVEAVNARYKNLGYFYLMCLVSGNQLRVPPDVIFKELTKDNGKWQYMYEERRIPSVMSLLFEYFKIQGYKDAVLNFYENRDRTREFTSEDDSSKLLLLYLFFEGICENKDIVREHYLNCGPQAKLYQNFINYPTDCPKIIEHEILQEYQEIKIDTSLSIISIFDKLGKFKIQRDIWFHTTKKLDDELKNERIKIGLCAYCGKEIGYSEGNTCEDCSYKVGDKGPAGGIIFYDKGSISDGWRFLEAAPANTEFVAAWGAYNRLVVGTQTNIGAGEVNTQKIVELLNSIGEAGKAAQLCFSLYVNGYNDWFLPSRDELNLMYRNLHKKGLGSFVNDRQIYYWSSSQYGNYSHSVWGQNFFDDNQDSNSKHNTSRVRAVRAF